MAFFDTTWYCNAGDQSTTGHYAVAKWAAGATIAAGALRRQLTAPAVGNERVFAAVVGGTTGGTEPTWQVSRGFITTDNTVKWQEVTGMSAVNGDLVNTPSWANVKAIGGTVNVGAIIKRNNGASYQINATAGPFSLGASEPAFSDTPGVTTAELTGGGIWTCLGPVGNFTGGQAPHARLASVFGASWFAVGNTVYVGDNHAESQASAISISPPQPANPNTFNRIICHSHSGSYPPSSPTTGATITATSSSNLVIGQTAGSLYVYGILFSAANYLQLSLSTSNNFAYYDNCVFKETGSGQYIQLSSNSVNVVVWNNCTVYFGGASNYIATENVQFIWQNTGQILASGSAVPTGLIGTDTVSRLNTITLEALDLSQLTGNLLSQLVSYQFGSILVKDCKLNASMAIATPNAFGQTVQLVRSSA